MANKLVVITTPEEEVPEVVNYLRFQVVSDADQTEAVKKFLTKLYLKLTDS